MTSDLTSRQLQVAQLVRDGWTDKQIAAELEIDEGTVGYHVGQIVKRLELDPSKNIRVQIANQLNAAA